uniref:Uncharacterized protein n=1 Tax=Chromera velia CCMP2878 TaxID=1169474 RepID=A0A0G4FHP4_9ALVE|eukprot:Cvel_16893.t1-p1 / transcript=Cvel_16893.t1 / gene=Cvel_16893 / organism=Chromera_velia_CCMP2878 / gene_product=hypothetical protein / transcript_product=hypothetical protein / location=Cvel_scaffold1322:29060-30646(+) / protein_length=529 / sequence_SO=supercontig / SO=protein_coding / is_pseudo=false
MEVPEGLRHLFNEISLAWHATALRALDIAKKYAETGNAGSRQGTRLVVCNADEFLLANSAEPDDHLQSAPEGAGGEEKEEKGKGQRLTKYGGVEEGNIRKFPKDIKTEEGTKTLNERMNDDGALIIDGLSGEFRASGFRLKYGGDASSIGGGLGAASSEECAKRARAFVLAVSHDGAIKLFAGQAKPVLWKGDTEVQPLKLRQRYPPSLKVGGDNFFGRSGPLDELLGWVRGGVRGGGPSGSKREEREGAEAESPPFIRISGIGGVGKSQLAAEMLHRCDVPRTKIWLGASSREHLHGEVQEVCNLFRSAGVPMDGCRDLCEWLETNSHWILVVDNLEDPELLWEFVPRNHTCTVVITSRDDARTMRPPPREVKLDTLQLPDAQTLLQTLAREPNDASGSEKLARALGCLPLGLVMASSLVLEKRGTLTFSDLAETVSAERGEVRDFLQKRGEIQKWTEYQLSVISLWRQQRQFLCEGGLSRAATLMECLSFADHRQISIETCETVGSLSLSAQLFVATAFCVPDRVVN